MPAAPMIAARRQATSWRARGATATAEAGADDHQRGGHGGGQGQPEAVDQGGHGEDAAAAAHQAEQGPDDQPERRGQRDGHRPRRPDAETSPSRVRLSVAVGSWVPRLWGSRESTRPIAQVSVSAEKVRPAPTPVVSRRALGER